MRRLNVNVSVEPCASAAVMPWQLPLYTRVVKQRPRPSGVLLNGAGVLASASASATEMRQGRLERGLIQSATGGHLAALCRFPLLLKRNRPPKPQASCFAAMCCGHMCWREGDQGPKARWELTLQSPQFNQNFCTWETSLTSVICQK